jgi:inosose dehydratase
VKLAAAPISWGVCEVPGWGLQLGPERVLMDMRAAGVSATEAGPPGFLPDDPAAVRALLARHGLALVGGFVTALLHEPARRDAELAAVERQATWLAKGGSDVLVLAAATGRVGYSDRLDIDDAGWHELFVSLDRVDAIARSHGLALAVHPHYGTVIEDAGHVDRFLGGCDHGLCLDTGHLSLGGADPVDVARRAGDRVRHVHLKDVDRDLASRVRERSVDYAAGVRRGLYCTLGDGAARVGEAIALLRERRYGGWYVLEQDVMLDAEPAGLPPWIERSIAFARTHG